VSLTKWTEKYRLPATIFIIVANVWVTSLQIYACRTWPYGPPTSVTWRKLLCKLKQKHKTIHSWLLWLHIMLVDLTQGPTEVILIYKYVAWTINCNKGTCLKLLPQRQMTEVSKGAVQNKWMVRPIPWQWEHLKADSHIVCRAHAVPLPCHPAKGLECVFLIWFTQCGRVWFTLAMPCSDHAVLLKATTQHSHQETACGLPARIRLLPAITRSSMKIVIRSIPILLTTIHTYDCK
jgi:hypothetical protein